jgi:hypothetical protein
MRRERSGVLEIVTAIERFSPHVVVLSHTPIGETDETFAWLARGYREAMTLGQGETRADLLARLESHQSPPRRRWQRRPMT